MKEWGGERGVIPYIFIYSQKITVSVTQTINDHIQKDRNYPILIDI